MDAGMTRRFVEDERGAVTADWVTLSAGIILLGIMVVFSVMSNSAGYLMDEFDDLNSRFSQDGEALALETGSKSGGSSDAAAAAAANASSALNAARGLNTAAAAASNAPGH